MSTASNLAALSTWIDQGQGDRAAEAITWGRLAKVSEECGEVIAAFIGATGQNPRKGVTHTEGHVIAELLDVAITALGAVEHMCGNDGSAMDRLAIKVEAVVHRAGLSRGGGRVAEESEPHRVSPAAQADAGSRERLDPLAATSLGTGATS